MSIPLHRRIAARSVALMIALLTVPQPTSRDAAAAQQHGIFIGVVYPPAGDKLPYVTRSFVFGSTTPGATVTVNGSRALVAASGGWIAYVPFSPGNFHLRAAATKPYHPDVAYDMTVSVAAPPTTTPAQPARVDAMIPPAPVEDMQLQPGDQVHLFLKASTGARVSAAFGDSAAAVPLAETSVAALSPSDKDRALGGAVAGGEQVGGLYEGELRIPATATGAARIVYNVVARDGTTATANSKATITVAPAGSYRVGTIVLEDHAKNIDARPYGIVESEPDGGWLFFPPPGTPFKLTGQSGDYYRVALGDDQAWVAKHDLRLAPDGSPAPHAQVQDVEISDNAKASTVTIHLTGRVPFRVDESVEGPMLQVRLFGASAATDFVRYGSDRSNIRAVRWDQLAGGITTITIALRQHTLWGYHADWNGSAIRLTIKKPPSFHRAPAPALQALLVVIDPGHSPDTGAIGPLLTQERDVNLAIARRLALRLQSMGARAVLTRYANVPVGLYDRTLLAQRLGADILISVHNNALPDGANPFTHHGYSVYYYQPQSLELARAIHDAYGRHTALADYGLYYDNLALARPTDEPAVLTESAFIMWPPEEMQLRDPAFQGVLAATLADGIERWAEAMRAREGTR